MRLTTLLVGLTMAGIMPASSVVAAAPAATTQQKSTMQAKASDGQLNILTGSDISDVSKLTLANLMDEKEEADKKPKPEIHKVKVGDTLTSVADQHDTEWLRLWHKNTKLKHPDILAVGAKLTIPEPKEKLKERALPAPPAEAPVVQAASAPAETTQSYSSTSYAAVGSSAGNLYTPGYCTWYVKNTRPDLPNNLGNADTWVSRAQAQGLPTGSTPQVGAVGQRNMHVVYVERVNRDGTVYISEMNYEAMYAVTYRTVPASYFMYIY